MRNPLNIPEQDRPISIVHEDGAELPFVILDVHGTKRARFLVQEDAQAFGDAVNYPEPELMQDDMDDRGVERDEEDREQPKEKTMPRGASKKKKSATKKRSTKKAANVKKAVQKTMTRKKKKRKAF